MPRDSKSNILAHMGVLPEGLTMTFLSDRIAQECPEPNSC